MKEVVIEKYLTLFKDKKADYNLSGYFIYPFLNIINYYHKYCYDTYLFCNDFKVSIDERIIYVLFRFPIEDCGDGLVTNMHYIHLKEYLLKNEYYYVDFSLKDIYKDNLEKEGIYDEYVCFVFKIPDNFSIDFDRFLKGEYSKYSNQAKERITGNYDKVNSLDICQIVKKDLKRRHWLEDILNTSLPIDAELAPIYETEKETLSIKSLLKNVSI
jgi:hypothetical protein